MTSPEHGGVVPLPGEIIGVPLLIGARALEALRITPQEMAEQGDPEVVLVELSGDDNIFALGGWDMERYAIHRGATLPKPQDIVDSVDVHTLRSKVPSTVGLAITRLALARLRVETYDFDMPIPPRFSITQFGLAYRLGGDMIADFVERKGARAVWGSNLDSRGHDNTGENSAN